MPSLFRMCCFSLGFDFRTVESDFVTLLRRGSHQFADRLYEGADAFVVILDVALQLLKFMGKFLV